MRLRTTAVFILCLTILFISRCYGNSSVKDDEGVLILNDTNFNSTLATSNGLLVKFYAPWCRFSKALAPEFKKAAALLKQTKSAIKLAEVDATKNQELSQRFFISNYPTLKFIKGDLIAEYAAGREAHQIVEWLNYKKQPSTRPINSEAELQTFIQSDDAVAVGFFKDPASINAQNFRDAAFAKLDRFPCGIVSNQQIMANQKVEKDAIIIFKKIDNEKLWFHGPFVIAEIAKFVKNNKQPLLNEYTFEKSSDLFDGDIKMHLLLFIDKSKPEKLAAALSELRPAAKKFRTEVMFIYVGCSEDNEKLMQFFDLDAANCPAVRFIVINDNMAKYKMDSPSITSATVSEFVQSVIDGKLQQHIMSQELPPDWDKQPVKILVGKNFKEVTEDKSKTVFVKFYAPWCKHSKQLAPIWQKLAEELKDNSTIVIAKIDGTKNEIENLPVDSYPTLKLFPANSTEILEYNGAHTVEAMKYFAENGKMPNKFVMPAPPGFPKGARIEVVMSPVMVGNASDAAKMQSKLDDKSDGKSTDKPTDKPTGKPKDKPADKPKDKPTDKTKDKPTEKPKDKPTEKPKDKPTDKKASSESDKAEATESESKRKPVETKEEL